MSVTRRSRARVDGLQLREILTAPKDPAEEPQSGGVDRSPSHPLFQRLRTLRSRLAEERDVPAYLVFSDEVLWAMVDRRPTTPAEMLQIPGVGPAKLARFGSVFLETLGAE